MAACNVEFIFIVFHGNRVWTELIRASDLRTVPATNTPPRSAETCWRSRAWCAGSRTWQTAGAPSRTSQGEIQAVREIRTGDFHGFGPSFWRDAASEWTREEHPNSKISADYIRLGVSPPQYK